MACVEGISDIHIPAPARIEEYPYSHTATNDFFDFNLFYYNDPFHHDIEHEQHTVGIQGYAVNDEPNDTRFDLVYPGFSAIVLSGIVMGLLAYADIDSGTNPQI